MEGCVWLEIGILGLGGIGIARGYSRTNVHVSRETTPPTHPLLLDNNNWFEYDQHYVNRTNVLEQTFKNTCTRTHVRNKLYIIFNL